MKRQGVFLLLLALTAACATNTPTPPEASAPPPVATTNYRGDETPNPVGAIPSAILRDSQRNRDIEMAIEYPTRGGPYPVIVFSHGFGGSKDSYVALTEYWTGQGYVCIKPSHADAGALRPILQKRREEMRKSREEMRQQRSRPDQKAMREGPDLSESIWQTQSPADWRNRVRDLTFVIDSLDQLEQKYPELEGKMDHAKIGVAGHSYGAFTTMLIAGARSFAENPPLQLADPRVRAAVAMSPQGVDPRLGLTPESWAEARIPILYMTGSNDRSGKQHDATWRHDPFAYGPPGDKYFVSIQGANHMSFAGAQGIDDDMEVFTDRPYGYDQRRSGAGTSQPRAMYPGMESSRRTFDSIRMATLSFWDAYLKADAKGRDYLNGSANTLNGGRITIERK